MITRLFTLILICSSGILIAQKTTPKEAFLEKWQNSKQYLIEIAESMPQEKYTYKPTEREMTFADQLLHIRGNMLWLGTTYFSQEEFDRNALKKNIPESKEKIITALKDSFDKVTKQVTKADSKDFITEVDFFAGRKSKLQILNLLQDHVSHHRGQLVVYLNLNEIKPPRYVGW